jgi:hypothetical protein
MIDKYRMIAPLAYGGKQGCESMTCRRMFGPDGSMSPDCIGWHCSYCDEPTGPQGHHCDVGDTLIAASTRLLSEETR